MNLLVILVESLLFLGIKGGEMLGSSNHLNHINNLLKSPNRSRNNQKNFGNTEDKLMIIAVEADVEEFIESANPE